MARDLDIRLNCPVANIDWSSAGRADSSASPVTVTLADGSSISCNSAIVTASLGVLQVGSAEQS
jgi:hypothetical protein